MRRKLQEQCDHIEKLLGEAGYKIVRAEPYDMGQRIGVLVQIDNSEAKAQIPCKT